MLAHSYAAATGIGDALRVAAFAKRDAQKHPAPVVIYVEEYQNQLPLASRVLQNLSFVDRVVVTPRGKQHPLPSEAFREGWFQRQPPASGLTLDVTDLRYPTLGAIETMLPERFTVVQSATMRFKQGRRITALPDDDVLVLVGTQAERDNWSLFEMLIDGAPAAAMPELRKRNRKMFGQEVIDLRGRLTLEETMYLCFLADRVVGVESWVPTLGAMFGVPSEMEISRYVWDRQGEHFRNCFPTMTWHVVDAESGIIEPTLVTPPSLHPVIANPLCRMKE